MQIHPSVPQGVRLFCAFLVPLLLARAVFAQPTAATGSIEGRVQNITRGDYLNNARVTVEGTSLVAMTNEFGEYRLSGVPVGEVRLTAFYSGISSVTETVSVVAGGRNVKDFDLKSAPAGDDVIKMAAFTVSSTKETSQAAIATNEQRFAPNMKTVLSAEEFGEQ